MNRLEEEKKKRKEKKKINLRIEVECIKRVPSKGYNQTLESFFTRSHVRSDYYRNKLRILLRFLNELLCSLTDRRLKEIKEKRKRKTKQRRKERKTKYTFPFPFIPERIVGVAKEEKERENPFIPNTPATFARLRARF